MGLDQEPISNCPYCGAEVQKTLREALGRTIEVAPRFCRHCGHCLIQLGDLRAQDGEIDEIDSAELTGRPSMDELQDWGRLEEVIRAAVPENYKELSLEELRRQIIGALWERYTGIYPYATPEQQAAMERQHEELMQQCIAAGTPPLMILSAPWSRQDEDAEASAQRYHLVWLNGLTAHLNAAPKEMVYWRPQLERNLYKVEPCDCNEVKYVPDEAYPHFRRKVEES